MLAVRQARPAGASGNFIRRVTVTFIHGTWDQN